MMKFKIGNDIIETSRIEKLCKRYNSKFKDRVFTKNEIAYCESKGVNKYQSYAGRFCVKEAVFKAISEKLDNKYSINWLDIEVCTNKNGKPYAKVNVDFIEDIDISISHVKEYAIANALVIFK